MGSSWDFQSLGTCLAPLSMRSHRKRRWTQALPRNENVRGSQFRTEEASACGTERFPAWRQRAPRRAGTWDDRARLFEVRESCWVHWDEPLLWFGWYCTFTKWMISCGCETRAWLALGAYRVLMTAGKKTWVVPRMGKMCLGGSTCSHPAGNRRQEVQHSVFVLSLVNIESIHTVFSARVRPAAGSRLPAEVQRSRPHSPQKLEPHSPRRSSTNHQANGNDPVLSPVSP